MKSPMTRLAAVTARLWRADGPLTVVGILMIAALAASLAGIWLDPRTITGAPAWVKPAKFAVSIAIYSLTLAWIFSYLPAWPRTRRIVGRTTAAVFVLEWVLIAAQAWRGAASHFNVGTPLDAAVFGIMGTAIVLQTLSSVAVAVALWREPFADRALGWALRLGLTITIIGASTGGVMTAPTSAQIEQARATGHIAVSGGHTVGAPDGGAGLPGIGWSLEHGDLRVAHFAGLHALQALALLWLAFSLTTWPEAARVRLMFVGAGSYLALFAILLWQALRAEALVAPGATTATALIMWAALTAASAWVAARPVEAVSSHPIAC